jgi:formamidopyrimidine-DNA glycosylase
LVPELPEVEFARSVIERAALGRSITDVDDSDGYVCRPHRPGQIRDALVGRQLVAAHRRGKSMWCDTDGGPALGVHLGMSGKIVVADPDGTEIDGGDYWEGRRAPGDYRWSRFSLTFKDGGRLMLVDPRRFGRIVLDPVLDELGPDAATISAGEFRAAIARGTTVIKARLLDQSAVAGIGNLLADEILWRARVHPARPVDELDRSDVERLLRATRGAVSAALKHGGVHTLDVIPFRKAGARCPRDDAPMVRGKAGGRTSWWCDAEQRLLR